MRYVIFLCLLFSMMTGGALSASSAVEIHPHDSIDEGNAKEKRSLSEKLEVGIEKVFRYAPLPALGYSVETSWTFGLVKYNAFRIRSRQLPDSLVKNSKVVVTGTYSLNNQYDFSVDADLMHGANRWNTVMRFSVRGFPSLFYGVGNQTGREEGVLTDFKNISFSPGVNYDIVNRNFIGIRYLLNNYYKISPLDSVADEIPYRENEGLESGVSLRYFFDSRDNRVKTERGLYLFSSFDVFGRFLGSDFIYQTLTIDLRGFVSPLPKVTLAAQFFSRLQGGDVPIQSLAFMGGNHQLRGYYSRRFREKSSLLFQGEVRFPLFWVFSGVAYGGMGQVAPRYGEMHWNTFHYAGGAGLRILFDKRSRSAVRFDASFSDEGHTFFIGFGEAF
jgi:hypothetical protein